MKKFKKTKKIGRKQHKAQGTDLVTEFYKVNQGKEIREQKTKIIALYFNYETKLYCILSLFVQRSNLFLLQTIGVEC